MTQACRSCGCTNFSACPGGCWWVEDDLCSSCDYEATGNHQRIAEAFEYGRNYPSHFEAVLAGDETYVCPPPGCALDRPPAATR